VAVAGVGAVAVVVVVAGAVVGAVVGAGRRRGAPAQRAVADVRTVDVARHNAAAAATFSLAASA
jgi:hypothetical protein